MQCRCVNFTAPTIILTPYLVNVTVNHLSAKRDAETNPRPLLFSGDCCCVNVPNSGLRTSSKKKHTMIIYTEQTNLFEVDTACDKHGFPAKTVQQRTSFAVVRAEGIEHQFPSAAYTSYILACAT